ncbi:MAG: phage tail terminator protein [Candidatus Heimdallarchaeaceae archaeon]
MDHSPAYIIYKYLVAEGLVTVPTAGDDWPMFVGNLPDGNDVKNNATACLDTTPVKDGRVMEGETIFHEGCEILLRSVDYNPGWAKMKALKDALDAVNRNTITILTKTYRLDSITLATGITSLGQEENSPKRREMFSLNFLVTLKET